MVVGFFISTLPATFKNPAFSTLWCAEVVWRPPAVGGEISGPFSVKKVATIWVLKKASQQACCSYISWKNKKNKKVLYVSDF